MDAARVDGTVDVSAGHTGPPARRYPWEKTARLAREYKHLRSQVCRLREELVAAVEAATGQPPTVLQAKLITDAQRHEAVARLCEQRLAKNPDMPTSDFVALVRTLQAATDASTRAIAKLPLDRNSKEAILERLYGAKRRNRPPTFAPVATGQAETTTEANPSPNASAGHVGPRPNNAGRSAPDSEEA